MRIVIGPTTSDINPWHLLGLLWVLYLHPTTRHPIHALFLPVFSALRSETAWHALLLSPLALALALALALVAARPLALGRGLRALAGGLAALLRPPRPLRDFARGLFRVAAAVATHVGRAAPTGRDAAERETVAWLRYYAYLGAVLLLCWGFAAWSRGVAEVALGGLALARGEPYEVDGEDVAGSAPRPWVHLPGCYFRDEPVLWTVAQESIGVRLRWLYHVDGTCTPLGMYE
ncbi:hypothetical protein F5X99DRAFT_431567 [Biscogniauxia marginata]|nr:hypothetical protein F5X99DRAFT_431567 [Biscogniauxia marginata]